MGGREADYEAHLKTKSGERLWAQVQLRPVRQDGSSAPADNLVRGVAAVWSPLALCWGGIWGCATCISCWNIT